MMTVRIIAAIAAIFMLFMPATASAYIGPGAGASLAGSLLGVLAAIFVALGIVLFWPLRLMFKKLKGSKQTTQRDQQHETTQEASGAAE